MLSARHSDSPAVPDHRQHLDQQGSSRELLEAPDVLHIPPQVLLLLLMVLPLYWVGNIVCNCANAKHMRTSTYLFPQYCSKLLTAV